MIKSQANHGVHSNDFHSGPPSLHIGPITECYAKNFFTSLEKKEVPMHIECPSCSADNEIEFGENIVCSKCNKSFAGHLYKKFKKPILSATTALFLGVFGTYHVDQIFFEDQRYPLGAEYEIIDNCVNSSRMLMNKYRHAEKVQLCVCVLEKTMEYVSYKELKKSESEFLTRFRGSISSCI